MTIRYQFQRLIFIGCFAGGALFFTSCGGSHEGPSAPFGPTTSTRSITPTTSFDSCLVGRWAASRMTETIIYNGLPVGVAGGGGTVITFASDGTETVDYSHAQALTGPYGNGLYEIRESGVAVYHDGTQSGELTFNSPDYSRFSASVSVDGTTTSAPPSGSPTPVSYQCSPTTLNQTTEVFSATYSRA